MSKSTLVQSAESVFVQRLLKWQCPSDCWSTEFDGKEVYMYEFRFELCCDGAITVWAYKDNNGEYVVVKSVSKPVNFSQLQ
jgi:hypothetical protein